MAQADATPIQESQPGPSVANLLAEAIGAFTLIFVGASTIAATFDHSTGGANLVAAALAQGLAIGVMVAATGHISGGVFNPALTLGLFIGGQLSAAKGAAYVFAQLVGATLAALAVNAIFPASLTGAPVNLGIPAVGAPHFTAANAFLAEVIATFFLMYVVFGVAIDKRGPAVIAGLAIGLTITIDIFAVAGVSGAAMNPARWFGPALVENLWTNAWVWILGPAVGAVLAALVHKYVYLRKS